MILFATVAVLTGLSFLAYGGSCLFARRMRTEFERYGLARFRALTGLLEVAGALGLLIGLAVPVIGFLAACGLALLMLLGIGVRLRIRDTALQTLPAVLYLLLTVYLSYGYINFF